MDKLVIWHNPGCSKSRQILSIIQESGHDVEIFEYLKTPPTTQQLNQVIKLLGIAPGALVRTKEDAFKNQKFDLDNNDLVIKKLSEFPKLIERPIVIKGNMSAVIGRPPENVKSIL